jgi:hypothetical protein
MTREEWKKVIDKARENALGSYKRTQMGSKDGEIYQICFCMFNFLKEALSDD